MGLKDRVLDLVASLFAPTMDHPAGGGMTGEDDETDPAGSDDSEEEFASGDDSAADEN